MLITLTQLSKPLSALHQCAGLHSCPNLYRRCISVQVSTALQTFIGVASVCRFPQLSKPLSALHQCAGLHSSPNLYRRCISVQVCGGETQISRNKRARCSNNTSFTAAKAAGNYKFYMQQQKPTSKPKGTENVTAANTARVQTTSLLFN